MGALDGGEWSALRPRRLSLSEQPPRYPLCRRLGGSRPVLTLWGTEKSRVLAGNQIPLYVSNSPLVSLVEGSTRLKFGDHFDPFLERAGIAQSA
jgi:hypothetical protein